MARRKGAGLARYFKPLQQRQSPKDARYKRGILKRERYIQALHRMRRSAISDRTALCNQVRGLLSEFGIVG
ncbi:MAG: hypothetical protein DSZ28_04900 [Thiothrix sp.]|nr:MAG: hypothetical protein DSZ28_04900 [Thiothrix sp.]